MRLLLKVSNRILGSFATTGIRCHC